MISTADGDLVTRFDGMRGFGGAAVQQNKTRVTKLLSNSTTRAQATKFEK